MLQDYQKAAIQKAGYLLLDSTGSELTSLALNSYLITTNFADPQRNQFIKKFADQICSAFGVQWDFGQAKRKVLVLQQGFNLSQKAAGLKYSDLVKDRLTSCLTSAAAATTAEPIACRPQDRVTFH